MRISIWDNDNLLAVQARSFRLVSCFLAGISVAVVALACVSIFQHGRHVDFLSYWAAGRLAIEGKAAAAYDIAAHRAVELTVVPRMGLIPFPYPPPFLLAVTPFALLSVPWAFTLWIVATAACYLFAMRRLAPTALALAHPSVVANGLIGQNGFLTAAIFVWGIELLPRSAVFGGAILGFLSIKPQLAILVPLALVAGREWRALAAAAISAAGIWLTALVLFGPASYAGFLAMLPRYADFMTAAKWPWSELASPFALFRFFDATQAIALAIHAAIAAIAAAIVCRLWWRKADGRAAALSAATLLIPPYLFTYDALLLTVAFGWLHQRRLYSAVAVAWLLCLLPVAAGFDVYSGPNTIPVAAVFCLWCINRVSFASGAAAEIEPRPVKLGVASKGR